MDYFFGHNIKLQNEINWFFNGNHLGLVLFGAFILIALYFSLWSKTVKGQKITKLILASLLLVLEISRIIYSLNGHLLNGGTWKNFNWWWNISFQMCAIMTWATIITLYISAFVNKDNKICILLKNILLGVALVGGFLTFVYPDFIDGNLPLLHFKNMQTILVHLLLIFVPIYLIKIKELDVKFKNIWMPVFGFLYVGCVSMCTSIISGQNFAFALETGLLNDIGLNIQFPWHLPVTFLIVFIITLIIYCTGELIFYLKNRNKQKPEKIKTNNKKLLIIKLITYFMCGLVSFLLLMLIASLTYNPIEPKQSMLGLLSLLPFILCVSLILVANYFFKKFPQNKILNNNK